MLKPTIKLWMLIVMVLPSLCYASQGIYLRINNLIPGTQATTSSSSCMNKLPATLAQNSNVYVENISSSLSCFVSPGSFNLNIKLGNTTLAVYKITDSSSGSSVTGPYSLTPGYQSNSEYYPHAGFSGSTDSIIINVIDNSVNNWMSRLNPALRLGQLFYPGSHDSGTAGINTSSFITPDADSQIVNLYPKFLNQIINWSKAQNNLIAAQLPLGVRYLDLRMCGDGPDVNSIYLCHSLSGEKFTDVVNAVKNFLAANPKEIVIMDFNHWYNFGNAEVEQQMRINVDAYLLNTLSKLIAPRSEYSLSSMVGSLQGMGQTLLIASDKPTSSYMWLSDNTQDLNSCANNSADICSYWPNAQDITSLTNSLNNIISSRRSNPQNNILILQTQLSPTVDMILAGLNPLNTAPSSLLALTGTYKDASENFLNNNLAGLSGIGFIDDFSSGIYQTALSEFNISHQPVYTDPISNPYGMTFSGNSAFITDVSNNQLAICDMTTANASLTNCNEFELSNSVVPSFLNDVAISQNTAYVLAFNNLYICTVSTNPQGISNCSVIANDTAREGELLLQ